MDQFPFGIRRLRLGSVRKFIGKRTLPKGLRRASFVVTDVRLDHPVLWIFLQIVLEEFPYVD